MSYEFFFFFVTNYKKDLLSPFLTLAAGHRAKGELRGARDSFYFFLMDLITLLFE